MTSAYWLIVIGAVWAAALVIMFFGSWAVAAIRRRSRGLRNRWGK